MASMDIKIIVFINKVKALFPNDQFGIILQATPTGEMQLLENEFSSTLTDFISSFLHQQDSIPAFLSSVTLDLYSRQTIVG